jgi:hypothetical protein
MSETEQHLEHAEHAQHAAHSPFDRRVTMTIAIIAALLACVTLLSHRAHNQTLQLQIEANDNITLASDKWNQFQGKKNRQYLYEAFADQTRLTIPSGPEVDNKTKDWDGKVKRYEEDNKEIEREAREYEKNAKEKKEGSEHVHHISDWYDGGELGVEIALVLCSVAVLTKRNGFWFAGMGVGAVGALLAVVGVAQQYLIH